MHVELACLSVGFSQRFFRPVGFFLWFFPWGVWASPSSSSDRSSPLTDSGAVDHEILRYKAVNGIDVAEK